MLEINKSLSRIEYDWGYITPFERVRYMEGYIIVEKIENWEFTDELENVLEKIKSVLESFRSDIIIKSHFVVKLLKLIDDEDLWLRLENDEIILFSYPFEFHYKKGRLVIKNLDLTMLDTFISEYGHEQIYKFIKSNFCI